MKTLKIISLTAFLIIINQSILKSQCESHNCDPQFLGMEFTSGCIQEIETTTLELGWGLGGSDSGCSTPSGAWGIEISFPSGGEYSVMGAGSVEGPEFDWTYDAGTKKLTGITNSTISWLASGIIEAEIVGMSNNSCVLEGSMATIIIIEDNDGGCEASVEGNMPGNDNVGAALGVAELTDLCVDRNCDPQLTGMEFDMSCVQEDKTATMLLGWSLGGGDAGCTTPPGSWAIQISLPSDGEYAISDAMTTSGPEFDWTYDEANRTLNGLVNKQLLWLAAGTIEIVVSGVTSTDCANKLSNANIQVLPNALGGCMDAFANQPGNDSNSAGMGIEPFIPCDLTPVLSFLPSVASGATEMAWTIKVQESVDESSEGVITVVLAKDPRLGLIWDGTETNIGGVFPVENSDWDYDGSNSSFHIWTTDKRITGLSSSALGFEALYDPGSTNGSVTYSVTILSGSGGELNLENNIDAENFNYFSN